MYIHDGKCWEKKCDPLALNSYEKRYQNPSQMKMCYLEGSRARILLKSPGRRNLYQIAQKAS
jgi:hypothetical protein